MSGNLIGNLLAGIVFFAYQICGMLIIVHVLRTERRSFQLLLGSVLGSFSLQWLPTIFSFVFGFNRTSNIISIVVFIVITGSVLMLSNNGLEATILKERISLRTHGIWLFIIPTFIYFTYVILGHTIPMQADGSITTGQATFGDMNLHLSIITSIANQGKFPPEYSILPGTKLSYPFLCDSISSSLYVFGSTLRFAYILPMLAAVLQCFYGFYVFMETWFQKKSIAIVAWVLFFFNGGFGFLYFVDGAVKNHKNFTRIFTEFYQTPTNYVDQNIRWINTIVDMLIPQRATLFGWAVLFPVLALLFKAVFEGNKYYLLSAIFISGLPMIHTHSFLTLAVVCAGWCIYWLMEKCQLIDDISSWLKDHIVYCLVGGVVIMEVMSYFRSHIKPKMYLTIPTVVLVILVVFGLSFVYQAYKKNYTKEFLRSWGVILLFLFLCSMPQLLYWTFQQASEGSFIKGNFNWSNEGDSYIWFYLKNLGLMAILFIPAMSKIKKRDYFIVFPALLLWFVAEFIQFQPNPYDNNKLLFPAYAFICGIVAYYIVELYQTAKNMELKRVTAVIAAFLFTISGLLTMGREAVSNYTLYGTDQMAAANYIEENTFADSIILTNTRHNNAISSLTGRNVLCGPGTFLFYHGVDYQNREADVQKIYEDATTNQSLLDHYKVDYIVIGPDERATYQNLNEGSIASLYPLIYQNADQGITIYAVSKRAQNQKK